MSAYIQAKDVVKVFRMGSTEVQALRGLNCEVEKGEMVAIVGASGSGKTTLLNILGGITRATAGLTIVAGRDVTNATPKDLGLLRRDVVGHIFQELNLIPTLTAFENVELPLMAAKVSRGERKKRAEKLLTIMGLDDRMKHKPDELSGGQRQRVAIAAALANDPEVLLADEPTGDLDSETGSIIVEYLHKVNKEFGKTVVMVTHDSSIARQCDRILRIQDGKIISVSVPSQNDESSALSRVDIAREQLAEVKLEIGKLDRMIQTGNIEPAEFAERRMDLAKKKKVFEEELHRLGL
ncbi:MAG: ATP-binding cassette domain-containing protein [Candidatus Lokiarchaeota archaeon]|nr:ATP-binding cassette domain-containing protein [Candidatus Lokiarchaeota archaeon]